MSVPSRLSPSVSGAIRQFAYWVAAGTVGQPLLDDVDYQESLVEEPSLMEKAFAIFANTLELDADGRPTNVKAAEQRAAQYIRWYCDASYEVQPPWQDWEVELH